MYKLFVYLLAIAQPTLAILKLLSLKYNIPHIEYISQGFWWVVSFNVVFTLFAMALSYFGIILFIRDNKKEKLTEFKKTVIDSKNYFSKFLSIINLPATIGVFFITNSIGFFVVYMIAFFICKLFKTLMISEIKNYFGEDED